MTRRVVVARGRVRMKMEVAWREEWARMYRSRVVPVQCMTKDREAVCGGRV
jgi:hypothetical protein